jgi:nitronate monooxygenase
MVAMILPKIIQGGMGIAISNWQLARTVATQGQLGVVSGAGVAMVMIARLMHGDVDDHVRRALRHFPLEGPAKRILDNYFVPEPPTPQPRDKRPPMWTLNPSQALNELTVIANFVEVHLAKAGHDQPVGINLLEKTQLPTMASLYGAMLAGVDFVIMGAGIPAQIPGILDKLADHAAASYRIDIEGATPADDYRLHFDPQAVFPAIAERVGPLRRPRFLPIVSSVVLAKALIKRSTGTIDGFVIETPTAGGHNAPPRGAMHLDDGGEPIYGVKDVVDLDAIKKIGLPFWMAGGYDSPDKLQEALDAGAVGIQVGTAFAYCDESGMGATLKQRVIQRVLDKTTKVRTDSLVSPTGFPFKVVLLEETLSDSEIFKTRTRLCDVGALRHPYKREDGKVGFRCPAEPAASYEAKGGDHADTAGAVCLCNSLVATAGFPQHRNNGYIEPPIVTAGDGLASIGKYIKPGRREYTALDVLDYLTTPPRAGDSPRA